MGRHKRSTKFVSKPYGQRSFISNSSLPVFVTIFVASRPNSKNKAETNVLVTRSTVFWSWTPIFIKRRPRLQLLQVFVVLRSNKLVRKHSSRLTTLLVYNNLTFRIYYKRILLELNRYFSQNKL